MITADQIVAHLVGDYVLQSDWMANEKTKKWLPAMAHAVVYSLCFLPVLWAIEATPEGRGLAMVFILMTHFAIDHWRLARYVVWAKNFLAPRRTLLPQDQWKWDMSTEEEERRTGEGHKIRIKHATWWHPWSECSGTGYHKDRPPWLAVWLLIIADNTLHLLCNGLAIWWISS